jgi:hypothetical protein
MVILKLKIGEIPDFLLDLRFAPRRQIPVRAIGVAHPLDCSVARRTHPLEQWSN